MTEDHDCELLWVERGSLEPLFDPSDSHPTLPTHPAGPAQPNCPGASASLPWSWASPPTPGGGSPWLRASQATSQPGLAKAGPWGEGREAANLGGGHLIFSSLCARAALTAKGKESLDVWLRRVFNPRDREAGGKVYEDSYYLCNFLFKI